MDPSTRLDGFGAGVPGVWWVQEATEPNWEALETFVTEHDLVAAVLEPSDFMWMAEVLLSTGVVIQLYKHTMTRRYLYLGDDGHAYWASGGCYLRHACLSDAVAGLELEL